MKFEYKIAHSDTYEDIEAQLNELGKEGWRVVAATGDSVVLERELKE